MDINVITFEELEHAKQDIIATILEVAKKTQSQKANEELLTSKQVCNELNISSRQFQRYRDEHRIAFCQLGRKIYVKRSDMNAFIARTRIPSRYEH